LERKDVEVALEVAHVLVLAVLVVIEIMKIMGQ